MAGIQAVWRSRNSVSTALLPLAGLFAVLVAIRRRFYRWGLKKAVRFPVPVIVVGNITVGGTGKTPLVIWLAQYLRSHGWQPGIAARGYGGRAAQWPQAVRADTDPSEVGDEAVLVAQRTGCPVSVGPDRPVAVSAMLAETQVDIVLSDDGLQHYALHRDLEIVVIDGQRRFGNGWPLPAGPLREPVRRLDSADLVVVNSGATRNGELAMRVCDPQVYRIGQGSPPVSLARFAGQSVHAVAGIGNPQRFFDLLREHGVSLLTHAFPDHHQFQDADLRFSDELPVLMTEKDAVKCHRFCTTRHWVVRIDVQPEPEFIDRLDQLLKELKRG